MQTSTYPELSAEGGGGLVSALEHGIERPAVSFCGCQCAYKPVISIICVAVMPKVCMLS